MIAAPEAATLRRRRADGESTQSLARSTGMPLAEIWRILYEPTDEPAPAPAQGPRRHTTRRGGPRPGAGGALTERRRPRTLEEIRGQENAVRSLRRFAAAPFPQPFLFEGATGTGKTTAALALAAQLGAEVDTDPPELGGLHSIASGEQNAEAVRDLCGRLHCIPMLGSGWKVAVVNEADRISPQAETIWLDRLEDMPPHTVVIFTTNEPRKLTRRLRDRCIRIRFEGSAMLLRPAAEDLAADLWAAETGEVPDAEAIERAVDEAIEDGTLSLRRVVQNVAAELLGRA